MRLPAIKFMVFNAAAGIVTLAALFAVVRSMLISPVAAPCTERYHAVTAFALERAGVVLTAAELQAGLGGRDIGVIDSIGVGRLKDGPAPVAMGVNLPKGSASPHNAAGVKGGVSFLWEPRSLQGKTGACLSYQVLLPADFDFHRGGALPGIAGAAAGEQGDRFLARLAWRPKGRGGVTVSVTSSGVARANPAEREAFEFPRGRWVKLDQEVVLNTPKTNNGILRVWVDGTLAIDRTDMTYRNEPGVTISGVSADVFYGTGPDDSQGGAPKDTKVWLSPFEIRWQ